MDFELLKQKTKNERKKKQIWASFSYKSTKYVILWQRQQKIAAPHSAHIFISEQKFCFFTPSSRARHTQFSYVCSLFLPQNIRVLCSFVSKNSECINSMLERKRYISVYDFHSNETISRTLDTSIHAHIWCDFSEMPHTRFLSIGKISSEFSIATH